MKTRIEHLARRGGSAETPRLLPLAIAFVATAGAAIVDCGGGSHTVVTLSQDGGSAGTATTGVTGTATTDATGTATNGATGTSTAGPTAGDTGTSASTATSATAGTTGAATGATTGSSCDVSIVGCNGVVEGSTTVQLDCGANRQVSGVIGGRQVCASAVTCDASGCLTAVRSCLPGCGSVGGTTASTSSGTTGSSASSGSNGSTTQTTGSVTGSATQTTGGSSGVTTGQASDGGIGLVGVCGNGIKETGEACDAGNLNGLFYGDATGCSKLCTREPVCRGTGPAPAMGTTHECAVTCGNGSIEAGEACDDGNQRDGDGCSSACTVESGFACTAQSMVATEPCQSGTGQCIELPVLYRDFKSEKETGGHPDFFFLGATVASPVSIAGVAGQPTATSFARRFCVPDAAGLAKKNDATVRSWDLATATLDAKGKPAFNAARVNGTLSDCQFTDWSHDTNGGHVPGYVDAANDPLFGLTYYAGPNGHPQYKGLAPIVTSAASFGQWFSDSSYTTAPIASAPGQAAYVGKLELAPVSTPLTGYQFASASHTVYGGFFPLDSILTLNTFPLTGGSMSGPGTGRTTPAGEPMLCNLWPYWYGSASFGAGANCRGDQYLVPPSTTLAGWVTNIQGWFHDSWFTTEARQLFTFNGAFSVQFDGDDDTFVYINGIQVIDLGGVHEPIPGRVDVSAGGMATIVEGGSVNSTTGAITPCPGTDPYTAVATTSPGDCRNRVVDLGLQPGKTYELVIFSADRHPTGSNFRITLAGLAASRSSCSRL